MTQPPANPKVYHILHVGKLSSVIADGRLLCDREIVQRAAPGTMIGNDEIKQRRFNLPVHCYDDAMVADFVPFYFCLRSIMLYVIYCGNTPKLAYKGGQGPIVHLEADLNKVLAYAATSGHSWAVSKSNAGADYATFFNDPARLNELHWERIADTDFRSSDVREAKMGEFLLYQSFPWKLVDRIEVRSQEVFNTATNPLSKAAHKPKVEIIPAWYY